MFWPCFFVCYINNTETIMTPRKTQTAGLITQAQRLCVGFFFKFCHVSLSSPWLMDGLVSSKCDHLRPHLLVIYQIVCSHGRAFVIKDLPWVGELVIAGKIFFFHYFKIAKQYGTLTCEFILHMHRLGRFDLSQFGFLQKITAQIWFQVNFDLA